ncbi:MAG: Nif3-like dinuclear metal center hexameric protein [Candidatus Yanofskyibacterium parasiticum]|jgi:putative NIF3 family GTP cyclohydrolase 1 type 2|nr:MAG: Nif3-like dinuclear metal center hexameric protein [Candidatus Yanofskybacteria bacterium]
MEADKLYQQLEKDFIAPGLSDDWGEWLAPIAGFVCDNFKRRSMGLVCDFNEEINKVYAAVFPSNAVMEKILSDGAQNAMLFVHHPAVWNIAAPQVFLPPEAGLLRQFKNNGISVYNLHVPLDNFGEYSTSVSLARVLGIKIEKAFAPYFGALCGVFGQTELTLIGDLKDKFEKAVGHKCGLYRYGLDGIAKKKVAVVAGGGNEAGLLKEIADEGVNVLLTGIIAKNEFSKPAHEFAKRHKINLLGGTHYSTEKFACIAMVDYFKKLGLSAEFVADQPTMEDIA